MKQIFDRKSIQKGLTPMTFDKEEVLKTIQESMHKNVSVVICTDCGGGGYNHEEDHECNKCKGTGIERWLDEYFLELLSPLITQAYQAGRDEERERIALEVASYAQLSVDETKYLLKIIKEED